MEKGHVDASSNCADRTKEARGDWGSNKLGGRGQVVEIDESLFRGRRKYNTGRMLRGNALPPRRQNNYGQVEDGPWIFGLVWHRPDGKNELRLFRRDATLLPIIEENVAPDTVIRSDEWRAYTNIGQLGYTHETVNHSENIVDPASGANTQRIETYWGHVKTKFLRNMRGSSRALLDSHLATYWWFNVHKDTPFADLCDAIAYHYPID